MRWRPLAEHPESSGGRPGIGGNKLGNLARAARAGLRVPPTVWLPAEGLSGAGASPPAEIEAPWIVRSASPTEDNAESSNAGQFVTRVVEADDVQAFSEALVAVVEALPRDAGRTLGAVFVQPFLRPERGGVAFFDGHAFEVTTAAGGNQGLTAGTERGEVVRGEIAPGSTKGRSADDGEDAWSAWLGDLARVFRSELVRHGTLDVEFAQDQQRFTLLQVRPATFRVRRNPLLTLANHREILGDPPSPWIASALERAGASALGYFAEVDPEVGRWGESYAHVVAGRAWLNLAFFFRLMDHWGLPRSFVTEGVGGEASGPRDRRGSFWRMARKAPRLCLLQAKNLVTIGRSAKALEGFRAEVRAADTLPALHRATVTGLGVALRTNFAINGALTGWSRVRRTLGIRGRARVTTEVMMEDYDALRALPHNERASALERWLTSYGHRGPLESDPARPRFAELREVLLGDLESVGEPSPRPQETTGAQTGPSSSAAPSRGPLYALDRKREAFRDELMRIWQELRARILTAAQEAGIAPADAFLFTADDFEGTGWEQVDLDARRAQAERLARVEVPSTATREQIEALLAQAPVAGTTSDHDETSERDVFDGVSLGPAVFEGTVQRARELVELFEAERAAGRLLVDATTVLVVETLEPSWAVVFGRVGAVVTELGGELSHASILLREAGKPAVVNCRGAFASLEDGDRVRVDGAEGRVVRLR